MEYLAHLSKDKKLKRVVEAHGPIKLSKRKEVFLHLVASIMAQQLSTKVAAVIYQRFLNLFDGKNPSPQQILKMKTEELRSIGLSNAKAAYIQNVARFALEHGLESKKLSKMSNDELIAHLTQIKGVGRWTVEMKLIFTLAREDVFSLDDLVIQNTIKLLYKLDDTNKKEFKKQLVSISDKWKPYRSYACLHLWKYKDA